MIKLDSGAQFRGALSLDASDAGSRFAVARSLDLEQWHATDLVFDAAAQAWTLASDGTNELAIHAQTPLGDGRWSIVFETGASASVFLRIDTRQGPFAVDPSVTPETANLLRNLHRIGWETDSFLFGQEFPLSYRSTDSGGNGDLDQSDSKDVTGDHPGIHGVDFLYMMDRPWEQDFHIAAAKRAYASGAVVTVDYHWAGKYGKSYSAQVDDNKILDYVVRNDDSRGDVTWFYASLDRILELINEDIQVPMVFRPFHEMDGNWFWWGRQMQGGAATYRRAYQLLVEYLSARTDYLLFCWSPDVALPDFEPFYPGDAYVDVVGRDIYSVGSAGRGLVKLEEMVDFAAAHGKVAAFTETGYTAGGQSFESGDPDWWTTRVLAPISASPKARKIAWVLTWINASWSGPYIPRLQSPPAAKDDFAAFYDSPFTLFQNEVAALKVYEPPPSE